MKGIFLDFDGVINSGSQPTGLEIPRIWFWPAMVNKVNDIIRATGAKLVISSDWRHGCTIAQLQDLLESYDCIGEIIGYTPGIEWRSIVIQETPTLEQERCQEIRRWLKDNSWPFTHWVAIDDLDLSDLSSFVQTDYRTGITDREVQQAIEILNKR
jgi:hypothetical protein